jgi:PBS lyase HEAT-like repeat
MPDHEMREHEIALLPSPLRNRAKAAFNPKADPVRKTYHLLLLQQETALYLAGLALAEYRGTAREPALQAEMEIASLASGRHATYSMYTRLLLRCIDATGPSSLMSRLRHAPFYDARRIAALLREASQHRRWITRRVWQTIEQIEKRNRRPISFEHYLQSVGTFRNRAFAHTDWHGHDDADDFFEAALPVLQVAATELLRHPEVTAVFDGLRPATVVTALDGEPHGYRVRLADNGREPRDACVSAREHSYTSSAQVLVRCPPGVDPTIAGPYWELGDGMTPLHPDVETTVDAILQREGPAQALAALRGFAEYAKKEWLPPRLVDDVVVSALEEFKYNGDNEDHAIPGNVLALLEYTSPQLPPRIIFDTERFELVTVRYPPPKRGRRAPADLVRKARSDSVASRREAAAEMGFTSDSTTLAELEKLAGRGERREVRKSALLSLAARKGRGMSEQHVAQLMAVALNEHRSDPEIACCAMIGLASVDDERTVDFLIDYVQSQAPYACTDTAAWALASIAERHPERVLHRREELLVIAERRNGDPYTRGTILHCLGKLGDADAAPRIGALIRPGEDPFVVEDACAALAALNDPRGVEPLIAVLEAAARDETSYDLCVQREAIRSLGALCDPRAQEALAQYELPEGCRFVGRVLADALTSCGQDRDEPRAELGERIGT